MQKTTAVKPWMNAKRITRRSLGEGGHATAPAYRSFITGRDFAEAFEDTAGVNPRSFIVVGNASVRCAVATIA